MLKGDFTILYALVAEISQFLFIEKELGKNFAEIAGEMWSRKDRRFYLYE